MSAGMLWHQCQHYNRVTCLLICFGFFSLSASASLHKLQFEITREDICQFVPKYRPPNIERSNLVNWTEGA